MIGHPSNRIVGDSKEVAKSFTKPLFAFLILATRTRRIPGHRAIGLSERSQQFPLNVRSLVACTRKSHFGEVVASNDASRCDGNGVDVQKPDLDRRPGAVWWSWEARLGYLGRLLWQMQPLERIDSFERWLRKRNCTLIRRLSNFRQRQQKSTPIIQQATADRVNRSCSQTQKDEWLIRLVAYVSQRFNQWPAPNKEREGEAHLWLGSRPMPSRFDTAGDCRSKESSLATERISDTRPIDAKNRDFSTVDHIAAIGALIER